MLDDEQVRAAWRNYEPCRRGEVADEDYYPDWHHRYLECVTSVEKRSADELRAAEAMTTLWSAKAVTPAGPGDSVSVHEVVDDEPIVNAIAALRTRQWPADASARARAMQTAHDEIAEQVRARVSGRMPAARLKRVFAVLFPRDLTSIVSIPPLRNVARLLLDSDHGGHIELQVRARARLRVALGEEADLSEHVWRSMFCWWLHSHYEALAGGHPIPGHPSAATPEVVAPLDMWSGSKQYTSILWFGGLSDTLREVIKQAIDGTPRDDLVDALVSLEGRRLAPRGARAVIRRAKSLGLLAENNGTLSPTEDGEEFLGDEQGDIVVRRLLERYFGFAHLLRFLSQREHGATNQDISKHLRGIHVAWGGNHQANHVRYWCRHLGLIESKDSSHKLTDYGRAWASLLPATLPVPPRPRDDEPEPDDDSLGIVEFFLPKDQPAPEYPDYEEIRAKLDDDPEARKLVIDDVQLRALHLAWRCHPLKRFVILAGLSGTGKTAIVLQYTKAVCELSELDPERHRVVVAVSPDWRDPSGLLGYFNALHQDPTFHAEPALRLVQRASRDPARPYFLILDEMNLARVERYFAPFLSSMETGNALEIHANPDSVNGVSPTIPWPANLHIAGTVNMDETTHAFSDKVLDRAFTLEFWDVDLPGFFARWPKKPTPHIEDLLCTIYDALRPVRRHFGYRTAKEILEFIDAVDCDASEPLFTNLLDQVVFSRVLPRVRGDDSTELHAALNALKTIMDKHSLKRCSTKVTDMHERLKRTGLTKFYA